MNKTLRLIEEAMDHASDLQLILSRLAKEAFESKNTYTFNRFREILELQNNIVNALDNLDLDIIKKENPAVIARPLKTAKKLKWWAIGLLDENKILIKRVVTQYRTRTEAKLYARSGLQMHSMGKKVEYALVEGPYNTMNEAQTAPLLFPEEV